MKVIQAMLKGYNVKVNIQDLHIHVLVSYCGPDKMVYAKDTLITTHLAETTMACTGICLIEESIGAMVKEIEKEKSKC